MESQIRRRQLELSEEQDQLMKNFLELTGDNPTLLWDVVLDYCGRNHPELYNDPDSKFKELVYLYWKYANRYGRVIENDGLGLNIPYGYNETGMHDWNGNGEFYGEQYSNMSNGCYFGEGRQGGMYEEAHMNENFNPEMNFFPSTPNHNMPMSYGIQHQSYDPSQCQPQNVFGYPMYAANNFVYSGGVRPFVSNDGTIFPASAVLPAHFVPVQSMQPLMDEGEMSQPMVSGHQFPNEHQLASRDYRHYYMGGAPGPDFYEGMPNESTSHHIPVQPNHHFGSGDPGVAEHRNYLNANAPSFIPKEFQEDKPTQRTSPQVNDIRTSTVSRKSKRDASTSPDAPNTQERTSPRPSVGPRKLVPYQGSRSDPLPITHGNVAKIDGRNVSTKINGLCNGHSGLETPTKKGILKTPPNGIGIPARHNNNNNSNKNKSRGSGKVNFNPTCNIRFADF